MHVDIVFSKIFGLHTELTVSAAKKTQRGLHRFLHHVSDLSRQRDIAFPWITRRLDVEHFAALRSVSEASDHAGFTRREFCFPNVFGWAKHFTNDIERDRYVLRFSAGDLRCDATTNRSDLSFQFAHAGFVRVIVDDPAKRVFLKFALLGFESVLL